MKRIHQELVIRTSQRVLGVERRGKNRKPLSVHRSLTTPLTTLNRSAQALRERHAVTTS